MTQPALLIRLLLLIPLCVAVPIAPTFAQVPKPAEPVEKKVTITEISGNRIRVVENSTSFGRGRGRARQIGQAQSTPAQPTGRSARGRGRRFSNAPSEGSRAQNQPLNGVTLTVPASSLITYAMTERRTNEFKIGASINGGLRNSIFHNIPPTGLPARIVFKGSQLIELNIIQANDSSLEDIAVKPKRPPKKK